MTTKENTPGAGKLTEGANFYPMSDDYTPSAASQRYGATVEEWTHFELFLELTEDLLPVISDPNAKKSPHSNIAQPGKLPSRYNRDGQMVGFPKWTEYHATSKDVTKWSEEPDYGICLQMRRVRAIDVDIDDFEEALAVEAAIVAHLGFKPPCRRRANSEKFLMGVIVEGDLTKRRFKTEKGVIEFLATGQQAVVVGTHPSGTRYEWDGGLPDAFPVIGLEEFEALWSMLNEKFGIEDSSVTLRKGMCPDKKRQAEDINDPLVSYLVDNWIVHDIDRSGRVDIDCPWKDGHSMNSGPSETSYFPAGVGGFDQGHFRCQHASCDHRTDMDFRNEIGYNADGFDVIPDDPKPLGLLPPPAFAVTPGSGKVKATISNIVDAIRRPDVCGIDLRFDTFRHGIMRSPPGVDEWQAFTDDDYTELRINLTKPGYGHFGFEEIGREIIRDAVAKVANERQFDSATRWLESLKWDGVPRVEMFIPRYFGADDTPYTRAIGFYVWTALAGRILVPGIKADMVPVAVGNQGTRKSSTVEAMSPHPDFFSTMDIGKRDDDQARLMRGKLVIELGELKGLRRKDISDLKDFIVRKKEEWTPKFREFNTNYYRRCVFFGTTNQEQFLVDDTGHRRWLPFDAGLCDPDGVGAIREQLWAEARELFNANGVMFEQAEELAKAEHEQFTEVDPWEQMVHEHLTTEQIGGESLNMDTPFTAEQMLIAIGVPRAQIGKAQKDRMGAVIKRLSKPLKLTKKRTRIDGVQKQSYVREGRA